MKVKTLSTIILLITTCFSSTANAEDRIKLKNEQQDYIDSVSFRILVDINGISWYLENEINFCLVYYCFDTLQVYDPLWNYCIYQLNNYSDLDYEIINSYLEDDRYKIIYEMKKKLQIDTYHGGHGERAFIICIRKLTTDYINEIYSKELIENED